MTLFHVIYIIITFPLEVELLLIGVDGDRGTGIAPPVRFEERLCVLKISREPVLHLRSSHNVKNDQMIIELKRRYCHFQRIIALELGDHFQHVMHSSSGSIHFEIGGETAHPCPKPNSNHW